MRCDALQQCERIAASVGDGWRESRRREQRIDAHDFLQQRRDRSERVPEDGGKVGKVLPLLAELEQGRLALLHHAQIQHVLVQSSGERAGCARLASLLRSLGSSLRLRLGNSGRLGLCLLGRCSLMVLLLLQTRRGLRLRVLHRTASG